MTTYTVAVVSAGLSQPSSTRLLADQLADATRRELGRFGDRVEVVNLELRELAHDITNNLLAGFPSVALQSAVDAISSADGVIAVTPVFRASYSGLFKSFFDILDPSALTGTPVLVAATGGSARHSLVLDYAMRPLFSYLKATIVPTGVFAATADFGSDEAGQSLSDRIDRAAGELVRLIEPVSPRRLHLAGSEHVSAGGVAIGSAVPSGEVHPGPRRSTAQAARTPDPFDALVPFEELLAR